MTERRKNLRRELDQELEGKLLTIETHLAEHVLDCSRNAIAMRSELSIMNTKFDAYHAQNRLINEEQVELLQALVTGKRVAVWTGRAIKLLIGILASAATALGLYTFFRQH